MSKADRFLTVRVCDSTKQSTADGGCDAIRLLSGPAGCSQKKRRELSLKEALFPVLDMLALMIAFVAVWGIGMLLSGSLGLCSLVFGVLRLLGIAFLEQDADEAFAITLGATLLAVALVSWRISDPLGTQLERVSRSVFGRRYIEPDALQSSIRWFEVLKSRIFAAIDVVLAGSALSVVAAGMIGSAYCFLLFVPLPWLDIRNGSLLKDLGFTAFFALSFLVCWRLITALQTFLSLRWNDVVAVSEKA